MTWSIWKTWFKLNRNRQKVLEIYWYVYWLHHNKKNYDCESINSVNPLYLIIGKADGYIEEKNGNKYLVFISTDGNKKVLAKFTKLCGEIKNLLKIINEGTKGEYERDFMKIKFNSYGNLPLNKMLKLHILTVIVISVLEENGKYYPQVFLDEFLYEL